MLTKGKMAVLAASALCGIGLANAHAQSTIDKLQPLVATSALRLAIGKQVALTKWDHDSAVEDAPREEKVIAGAIKDGQAKGLDPASVSNFFKAQIEANKIVQYVLLADWRRAGKAPTHAPIDLVSEVRPQLDQVQEKLITELVETVSIRSSKTCQVDIAKAVGKYLSTHQNNTDPAFAVALDRALAAACIP